LIASFARKLSVMLLGAALLAGCTATFTYKHLDWLIPWYVDGYVDLSRDQRRLLQDQLGPALQWHQQEELSRYVEILDQIKSDLAREVSAEQIQQWVDDIILAAERVEERMLSVALDFGSELGDQQIEEFVESLWEQQREYEEEYLDRDEQEYVDDSYENLEDFLKRFTGRLQAGQEQTLRQAADSLRRFDAAWLEERESWLNTLVPLLQRQDGWQDAIILAYRNREQLRPPQYMAIMDHNTMVVSRAMADILNALSDKQRQHVFKEIDKLRSRINRL
jgi:hypothetical protein